ncbi:MAG: ShlB/FhaC/HecB family hemolysin secretion/activation protein [Parvularculaceae bacterium]
MLLCAIGVFTPYAAMAQGADQAAHAASTITERLHQPDDGKPDEIVATPTTLKQADGVIYVQAGPTDIEKRLPDEQPPSATPEPSLVPPPPPLREGAPNEFVLIAVNITGATAIPAARFAPLYDDLLARRITTNDVAKLVEDITALYRKDGYILSRATAPAQTMADGVLRIDIAEGYIAAIQYKGEAMLGLRNRLAKLKDERPLRLATLERALALAGDFNGVKIKSTHMEPDPHDLARHTLVVEVETDRLEASLYADNRGTDEAGPVQTYARVAANSLIMTGDRLSVGAFTTPESPSELALAEASYQLPLTGAGTAAILAGSYSHFNAGADLSVLDTEVRTTRMSFTLSHPFLRGRKLSLWGNAGIEARNIEEEQLGSAQYEDRLRVLYASANLRKTHLGGVTSVYARATRGLDMLGASQAGGSLSRPDADGEFTKFDVFASRYQDIGKVFGFYAAAAGQISLDPLLASEEFSLGGARFGRAYDYSELTGEDGVAVSGELRYGRRPGFDLVDFYQLYLYADYGAVWNDNAAPGFDKRTLASAGGGLRLTLPEAVYVTFELARPLDRTPYTQDDRDWRGFFSFSKTF